MGCEQVPTDIFEQKLITKTKGAKTKLRTSLIFGLNNITKAVVIKQNKTCKTRNY